MVSLYVDWMSLCQSRWSPLWIKQVDRMDNAATVACPLLHTACSLSNNREGYIRTNKSSSSFRKRQISLPTWKHRVEKEGRCLAQNDDIGVISHKECCRILSGFLEVKKVRIETVRQTYRHSAKKRKVTARQSQDRDLNKGIDEQLNRCIGADFRRFS